MPQFLRKRLHFQEEVALRNTRQEYSIPGSPFDLEGGSPFLGQIYTITTPAPVLLLVLGPNKRLLCR